MSSDTPPRPTPALDPGEIVMVYDELRRKAAAIMRGHRPPAGASRPTALVLRWIDRLHEQRGWTFEDLATRREDVLRMAGVSLRRLLIDLWRRQRHDPLALAPTGRAGGDGRGPAPFEILYQRDDGALRAVRVDLERLDAVMERLYDDDPEVASLIDRMFFLGLTQAQIAEMEGTTRKAIERRWSRAREVLRTLLADAGPGAGRA